MNQAQHLTTLSYEAWRITYQSSEQAARAAYARMCEQQTEQVKESHRTAEWKLRAEQMEQRLDMANKLGNEAREQLAALKAAPAAQAVESSATYGMHFGDRILHIGGRENAAGYIEFGSVEAVRVLVGQVLRDLPDGAPGFALRATPPAPAAVDALREAEAALEVAIARILKANPSHSVSVTSEAKALVIVRAALAATPAAQAQSDELEAAAEHQALRDVYEQARGVLRYDGVDELRALKHRDGLIEAIEVVKTIDGGNWEPAPQAQDVQRVPCKPIHPKGMTSINARLAFSQGWISSERHHGIREADIAQAVADDDAIAASAAKGGKA